MEDILEIAQHLACAVRNHEYYTGYTEALKNIENNSQLKKMLDEYRRKQFELSIKQKSGFTISAEDEDELENVYSELQASPEATEFLYRENQMLDLLSKIYHIINKNISIDLNF